MHAKIVDQPSIEVAGRRLVVPGDPASSYLFEKISSNTPSSGMRMPYTNAALPAEVIEAVRAWIAGGALDD